MISNQFLLLFAFLLSVIFFPHFTVEQASSSRQFTITQPTSGSSYNVMDPLVVGWKYEPHGKPVYAVKLSLMDGEAQNANEVMPLDKIKLSPYQKEYFWKAPPGVVTRPDYFIKLTALGEEDVPVEYAFSGRFGINNDGSYNNNHIHPNNNQNNQTDPSTTATTTTSASTSTSTTSSSSSSLTSSSSTATSTKSTLTAIESFGSSILYSYGFSTVLALFVFANVVLVPMALFL